LSSSYEGDLIRPLGLVTLYAAYAEGEVELLLETLSAVQPLEKQTHRWPMGQKIGFALDLVAKLNHESVAELIAVLKEADALFAKRNELIHGRLYSGGRLESNCPGVPVRKVTAEELVEFAEQVFNWKERLNVQRCRKLLPLLAVGNTSNAPNKSFKADASPNCTL
jgi:hypothetical protein